MTDKGALAANEPSARSRVPAPAVLDLSHADGGVVLHQFTTQNPREVFRAMQTAPAEGYQSSFVLEIRLNLDGSRNVETAF